MIKNNKDEQLIAVLRDNGRISISDLARTLGVSRTSAQMRLEKLQRNGVITGYGVRLSTQYLQGQVRALVMIKARPTDRSAIEQALTKMPELTALYSISGIYDLTSVITASSVEELDRLIDHIGNLEGVSDTMSSVILSTRVDR